MIPPFEAMSIDSIKKSVPDFLLGGGEMGERIRNFDWTETPLGEPEYWDQSLKTSLTICLNSNFPIALYWGNELILLYNDAWSPIPGNKHPGALGKPAKEVWKDIWKEIEPEFSKAFEGTPGGSKDALLPMQRHGYTEECYFDFTFTPVRAVAGKVEGVFNAVIETTYRVINERRSNFLNDLSLTLASASTQEKVFQKVKDFFRLNNKPISFAFFYDVSADNTKLFLSTEDSECKLKQPWPFKEVSESKKLFLIQNLHEYLYNVPKGSWEEKPVEAVVLPVTDINTNIAYYIVCGLNARHRYDEDYKSFLESLLNVITKILNTIASLEEERRRSEALAEIDKAKTLFFTNISHEFRTPLTLMLGPLEEALNDSTTTPQNQVRLDVAQRNAMRLLKLVNSLLDFSRIESGKQQASYVPTDIGSYTENLAANFRSVIEKAGLKFIVHANSIVQPVYIDRQMWEKIVFNLLSNAFKYTLEGSIIVEITAEDDHAVLRVKDTGVGIPGNELSHMFDRFHRVENISGRTFEGSGIGLSLVKELVQLHGGSVSVQSQQGVGSTFTVTIPFGKEHLPASQIETNDGKFENLISEMYVDEAETLLEDVTSYKANSVSSKTNGSLPVVMVVDDNPDMRKHLQRLLSTKFSVVTSPNGLNALHELKEKKPDLILSDVMMPEMDGIQLLKAIKSDKNLDQIPVILLTARAGEESKIEGWETGADDYLVKPFSSKELIARISAQIKIKQKRDSAIQNIYNIFNEVPFAVAVLKGKDLVIDFINQYNLDVWQRKRENVLGKPLFEVRPDIRESAEAVHAEVYRTGKRFATNEIPIALTENGKTEIRYFNAIIDPLFEDGKLIGQLAASIDVTEQVFARKKIEESEKRFRALAEATSAIVWTTTPDGRFTTPQPSWEKYTGQSWDEYKDLGWANAIHPDDREFVEQLWREALEQKKNYHSCGRLWSVQHQAWHYYDGKAIPLKDNNDEVIEWVGIVYDVHEQKETEEKIKESEARFRFLFESNLFGVAYWRISGEVYDANDNLLNVLGYTREDMLTGKVNWRKFTLPSDAKLHEEKVRQAMEGKTVVPYETKCITKDGRQITALVGYAMLVNSKEKGIAFLHDVTKAKEAETAIRLVKEQLEQTFRNIPAGVFLIDKKGEILFVNDIAARMSGYASADEMVAEKDPVSIAAKIEEAYEIFDEQGRNIPIHETPAALALQTKKSNEDILEIRNRKTKSSYWVLAKASPLFDADGNLSMVLDTSTDITIQKLAEREIRQSEERFRTLAETLPQMVWMLDSEGKIEYGSKLWEEYSGIKNVRDAWPAMVHPDDWKNIMSAWEENYKTGIPYRYEVRLKNKEGEYRWHYASGSPVKDESGKVTRWIGALTDIHVQKSFSEKLEQEVAQRTDELVKANKQLESFTYIASHDLQEPLRKIQMFSDRILQTEAQRFSPESREYFNRLSVATARMKNLIESLLHFSLTGISEANFVKTDLNQVLHDVKQNLQDVIEDQNVMIESDQLPTLKIIPLQIQQLFSNLISNSIKYSKENINPHIKITAQLIHFNEVEGFSTTPQEKYWEIQFIDNGIGFEQQYEEKIFELFQRLHSRNEYSGTGIGLAICKKIVQNHNGYITATAKPGVGATFKIYLPEMCSTSGHTAI